MTLSTALRTATSSLAASAKQVSVLSRNIAGVADADYVRRNSTVSTDLYGTVSVKTQRYVNRTIYDATILANANTTSANIVAAGFNNMIALNGTEEFSHSPAALLGKLQQATEFAAASPAESASLSSMIESARTAANSLNQISKSLLSMKATADKEIGASISKMNDLLDKLHSVNDEIVSRSRIGLEVHDGMDKRDAILSSLSEEIGIKVTSRENNDIVVVTNNGLMLFEKVPRSVSFQPTPVFGPNTAGNIITIDGVAVGVSNSAFPLSSGRLAGNIKLRDEILPQSLTQLDEIARGLIEQFSEKDQSSGGGKPAIAGLLTWSGGPSIPLSAALEQGIALTIKVNPLVDPQSGGNMNLIRDGGINGDADYITNSSGAAGFSDRLFELSSSFDVTINFDVQGGLPTDRSLLEYANSALDWLNSNRQSALSSESYHADLAAQYKEIFQNETGPNLDFEMSKLLEIERTYQASAKLMATIDDLFSVLLNSVR